MSLSYIILICCSLATICSAMNLQDDNSLGESDVFSDIQIIEDIEAFRAENADAKIILSDYSIRQGGVTNFYFGSPSKHDVKIAEGSKTLTHTTPQNFQASLEYPSKLSHGSVQRVTYIQIAITTDAMSPKAYITSGDIGHKNIKIALEATHGTQFSYKAVLYSSANRAHPLIYSMAIVLIVFVSKIFIKL